jgi:hypothetical protein
LSVNTNSGEEMSRFAELSFTFNIANQVSSKFGDAKASLYRGAV